MMPMIRQIMLEASNSLAVSIIAKATVVMALGLIVAWLARGNRAAVRHVMLAASFAVLLALPGASLLVPRVRIAVAREPAAPPPVVRAIDVTQTIAPAVAGDAVLTSAIRQRTQHEFTLDDLLLAGWMAGAAIFVLRIIAGLREVHLLRRSGLAWRAGQVIVDRMASDAGIHRHVEVLLHESLPTPWTCGIFLPAIVLPSDVQNWQGEDLSRAIIHELEHVRRGDWVSQCLARSVCAAYWFHPLVWIAWCRLLLEAERACDDAVLRRSDATAYADQLVGLARRLSAAQRSPLLALVSRADLARRVGAVLDSRQPRGRAGGLSLALATTTAMVMVISMSSLMLVATPQAMQTQTVTPPQFDAVSVKQIDPKGKGGPVREKPDPLRLVAQWQPATLDRTASATRTTPKFEVASIKPCDPSGGRGGGPIPGRLYLKCVSVKDLIGIAYRDYADGRPPVGFRLGSSGNPITGGPAWISSAFYEINAKPEGSPSPGTMRGPMLQALLEDRFKVKIRRNTKEVPAYALTVAKSGFKLKSLEGGCLKTPAGEPPGPLEPGQRRCGGMTMNIARAGATLDFKATTVAEFSQDVRNFVGRPVVDKTAIAGVFDFHLEFEPEENTAGLGPGVPSEPSGLPSIFTALQEQLGLKLESGVTGLDEVIVIENVERPTYN